MSRYGILVIANDSQISVLVDAYIQSSLKGATALYNRQDFKGWLLDTYDAHEFAYLSEKRVDKVLAKWEVEAVGGEWQPTLETSMFAQQAALVAAH